MPLFSPKALIAFVTVCGSVSLHFTLISNTRAQGASALAELDLEQLIEVPVEFVSGVSKFNQSKRQAPASVTVLSSADIKNYGWRTLADALRSAPGFHIRSDRFYEYVGNRGFTRPYDYNSRTLVLVDGHRINDAIYQQGAVGTEFLLDPDLIERIEIIRGPGSSIYGSGAFYGAINVIPKQGRVLAGGQTAVSIDSSPGAKVRVSYGDRTPGGLEFLVSATGSSSRGESDFALPDAWRAAHPSFTQNSAPSADNLQQQQVYSRVGKRFWSWESAYGRREKEVLPTVYNTALSPSSVGVDERAYTALRLSAKPFPDAAFNAKTALDYYHYEGKFSPVFSNLERLNPFATALTVNTEVRWHQTFEDKHSLMTGLELQNNLRQDSGRRNLNTPSDSLATVRESSTVMSPFLQIDAQVADPLRLSLGARYDDYSTGESSITPRMGAIWESGSQTTFKLLYGESFRVPNLEERHPGEAGSEKNPALGPESNESWEFSVERVLSSIWTFDIKGYEVRSEGLITTANLPSGNYTYVNQDSYRTIGLEFGGLAHFSGNRTIRASLTRQRTEDDATQREVADAPEILAKLNLTTPLYQDWLRCSVELQYVGKRSDFSSPAEPVEDFFTGNLTLRAAPLWHRWDLAITVYNVADSHWTEPKNSGQIATRPRSAVLRITRDF